MPWINNLLRPNHQDQVVIQKIYQDENDVFHMAIIALEKLEECLNASEHQESHLLLKTAIGTRGDHHTTETSNRDKKDWIAEIMLHCQTIYMNSDYDDKDIFDAGVKMFIENLLEWYSGRRFLSYYDAVDACVIPLILAISHQKVDFEDIFKKYVCDIFSDDAEASLEQKYEMTKDGFEAYQNAQYILEKEQRQDIERNQDVIITSHKRGNVLDGYRRIINGLTSSLCETAAPAKLFYKTILKYHPDIVASVPEITEAAIDDIFTNRINNESRDILTKTENSGQNNKSKIGVIYPKLQKIIKDILDIVGIEYNEIEIEIQ